MGGGKMTKKEILEKIDRYFHLKRRSLYSLNHLSEAEDKELNKIYSDLLKEIEKRKEK